MFLKTMDKLKLKIIDEDIILMMLSKGSHLIKVFWFSK